MKLNELANKIKGLSAEVVAANKERLQIIASNEMEFLLKKRVFAEGKDSSGSKIGSYSTKEIYVNPNKISSLIPKSGLKISGKFNKSSKFKNGNPRKTAYLGGGYKEFKEKANFDSNIYNLTLTGTSKDSIKIGKKGNDIVLGFSDEGRRKILEGHEERLNKEIFKPTKDELKSVRKIVKDELKVIVKETIGKW